MSERERREFWADMVKKPKAPPLTPAELVSLALNCEAMASPDPTAAFDAIGAMHIAISKAKAKR